MVKQAVVLAAGKGERLYPLTSSRPKVMLPIGNKPMLQYVVEALKANDVEEVVIVVGYYREQIQDYFGSGEQFGLRIRYAHQEHQLGTGHALLCAREVAQERFLVLPGDNIIDAASLRELVNATYDTILVKEDSQRNRYGAVVIQNGLVQTIVENPQEQLSPWINTGTYMLHRTVFDHLADELDLPVALNQMIQKGGEVTVQAAMGTWLDAAYPWDLLQLNGLAVREIQGEERGIQEPGVVIKGPVHVGENTILRANSYIMGPVLIGDGCEIGPNACIFPYTSLGNNVVVDPFTQLRNCIIGNSVQIGSHSILNDSIVAEGCTIGPRLTSPSSKQVIHADGEKVTVQIGAIMADFVEIGAGVSLRPGITVGRGSRIRDMNVVREDVPDESLVI